LDSVTKVRLAAAVDQQAGKKWYTQLKTWSDVKAACEHWSENLRERLIEEGVRKKA
jgi:NADP-dependent 3-hydroxy acid dehydrogenase YdfG